MEAQDPTMLLNFFKALAHESRLRLLGFVAEREHNVQELAARMALKEPTVSHHLGLLKEVGLVSMRQDGTTHWYMLEPKTLSRLAKSLLAPSQLAALKGIDDQPTNDEKIVRNYLTPDGRLKDFPASRKKRRVILVWLARQFDEGREYSETDVNTLIERRHHDRETFRRELVGYKMLARKGGVYRRLPEENWQP
ncbi:MAG: metalloregulator ArsR/SmtB family transcription factor [Micropepsaceae bacterium]